MNRWDEETVARIGHDLRGPLAVVSGFAALLAVRGDERLRLEAAEQITAAANLLSDRIDSLLVDLAPAAPGEPVKPLRIVVIDDDPHLRSLLRATLDAAAFEVIEASDGAEARAMLDPLPALVVLDWHLPGTAGGDVLREIKQADATLPVIVLTGDARSGERALADSLGADAYLTKPFSPLQLLNTIERLIRHTSQLSALPTSQR
jgi:CheY-like chemotaxis protein